MRAAAWLAAHYSRRSLTINPNDPFDTVFIAPFRPLPNLSPDDVPHYIPPGFEPMFMGWGEIDPFSTRALLGHLLGQKVSIRRWLLEGRRARTQMSRVLRPSHGRALR